MPAGIKAKTGAKSQGKDGDKKSADINTGESFWEYHPAGGVEVISNVAVLNDLVYFLASDKTLRAVELHTGKQVGQLQSRYLRSWHDLELGEYISVPGVAASESLLFVSFGGRTLYAFAPKD